MHDELPPSRSWKDLDEPYINLGPAKISLKRKIWGGVLAVLGVTLFILGVMFPVKHIGFFIRSSSGAKQNDALIWLSFAFLYCAALTGLVRTNGGAARVGLGCLGSILFALAFIAYVAQTI
jgi:hypothetical protein